MTDSVARRLMGELLSGAAPTPELVVERGPAVGQRLHLPPPGARVVIGRGEGAGWIVLDPDLSRAHAAIDHRSDGAWLLDLGSKNGTRVDGVPAPRTGAGLRLADGAVITLGATAIRVRDPAAGGAGDVAAGGVATRTHTPPPAAELPPRWPIVLAAVVAVAALAVLIVLLWS